LPVYELYGLQKPASKHKPDLILTGLGQLTLMWILFLDKVTM